MLRKSLIALGTTALIMSGATATANAQSAASSVDQVYRARTPVFAAVQQRALAEQAGPWSELDIPEPAWAGEQGIGVEVAGIVESQAPLERRYEPGHPLADGEGYVYYPNVNVVEQMADVLDVRFRLLTSHFGLRTSAKSLAKLYLHGDG